jgi:Relaxase/Mobilisation nuclease domain
MIVKILSNGKSFSGLATYLSHDADRAKSTERLDWTHTLNCANDDMPCAVNEMLWTARDAELLKQEAGIRAGGRATENTVKHFSLSWSPEEKPSPEHMIETTQDFLRHMKWEEHQAILFSHTDKPHAHVHCMLNTVHPETGLRLNDSYEQVRAQEWALEYERQHGIYCEQRLLDPEEREPSPPRNIWMQFWVNQKEFEKSEKSLAENQGISPDDGKIQKNDEWKILKEIQRDERLAFFAEGKSEYQELRASIFREVRDQFRGRWTEYYEAERNGTDPETLAARKAQIVADQKSVLEPLRDEACKELRADRDTRYRELLDNQRDLRTHLHSCQEAGLDNMPFLLSLTERDTTQNISEAFREAAEATTIPVGDQAETRGTARDETDVPPAERESGGAGTAGELGLGVFGAFDSLLSIFEGTRPAPARRKIESGSFESAAQEAAKREHEREDAEERERHRALYGE